MARDLFDLGNLMLGTALFFGLVIVSFEWAERRRENKRERQLLDAIEEEYREYCRMGRL